MTIENFFPVKVGNFWRFHDVNHPDWVTDMKTGEVRLDAEGKEFDFWLVKNNPGAYWGGAPANNLLAPHHCNIVCRSDQHGIYMLWTPRFDYGWTPVEDVYNYADSTNGRNPQNNLLHIPGWPVYPFIPAGFFKLQPYIKQPFKITFAQSVRSIRPTGSLWFLNDWTMELHLDEWGQLHVRYLERNKRWPDYPNNRPAMDVTRRINEEWVFAWDTGPVEVTKTIEVRRDGLWQPSETEPVKHIKRVE